MLAGPGNMMGPKTLWWGQQTSPELHLPFSCSQASGLNGQKQVGECGGTEGMRKTERRAGWREKYSIES